MTQIQLVGKTNDELIAIIASMQAQSVRKLSMKVSEKGAVSLYGMGKFPVTLYGSQWDRVLNAADDIREFMKINAGLLSVKA